MKKLIITSLFFIGIFSQNCFGQLKVDSSGHVGIGTTSTSSTLSIGGGNSIYYTYINPPTNKNALCIRNYNSTGLTIGNNYSNSSHTVGIEVSPYSGTSSNTSYGIKCFAGSTTGQNYGLYASLPPFTTGSPFQAAVFGTVGNSSGGPLAGGDWAGYFGGNVAITGTLTAANISSPSLNSNLSSHGLDNGVARFPESESVSEKLQNICLLEIHDSRLLQLKGIEPEPDETVQNIIDAYPESYTKERKQKEPTIRYTLAADELKESFPELVSEDDYGNVSINYIEMVPLLVQSIKELNAKIDELQGNDVKKVTSRSAAVTSIEDSEVDLFSVSQNEPNPFTESTTIKLSIPKKTQTAALIIYDMSGKQIKQISINERGKTSVNITSEGLIAGMYLYSLIADGKVISTKRMILTK